MVASRLRPRGKLVFRGMVSLERQCRYFLEINQLYGGVDNKWMIQYTLSTRITVPIEGKRDSTNSMLCCKMIG